MKPSWPFLFVYVLSPLIAVGLFFGFKYAVENRTHTWTIQTEDVSDVRAAMRECLGDLEGIATINTIWHDMIPAWEITCEYKDNSNNKKLDERPCQQGFSGIERSGGYTTQSKDT